MIGFTPHQRHPGEHNDCAVQTVAKALRIPYIEAHAKCKALGRKDGHPTSHMLIEQVLGPPTWAVYKHCATGVGVNFAQWVKLHRRGRYAVRVHAHMFYVQDGVVYDFGRPGFFREVLTYWRLPA